MFARELVEANLIESPESAPLKIDEDAGIIYGVKVLGRYSGNRHELAEAVNGTEYTPECMRAAIPLYEDQTVHLNHPEPKEGAPRQPGMPAPRKGYDVASTLGVIRNVRMEGDELRGDLHYNKANPFVPQLLSDIRQRLGRYGLSHNAASEVEHFDERNKRLVVDKLATVRSVDLVDKPATTRNLWESQETPRMKKKIRIALGELLPRMSKVRQAWGRRLLEADGDIAAPLDIEMDAESGSTPEDTLKDGFYQAMCAILDKALSGDMDPVEAHQQIKEYLKTHSKLTEKAEEPAAEPEEGDDLKPLEEQVGDGSSKQSEQKRAMEFNDPWDGPTRKSKKESLERLAALELKDACRDLCEELSFSPSKEELADLMEIKSAATRRRMAEKMKAAAVNPGPGGRTPRSGFIPKRGNGRSLTEGQEGGGPPTDEASQLAHLRRGA